MGQPAKAFKLFCRMREEGVEPTSAGFNSILDMIARQLSQPEVLDAVLSDVVTGAAQDHVACALLIKASCSAGNIDNAMALFRQLRSRGMEREHAAMNALLLACARADLVTEAGEVFEDMRQSGRTPNSMAGGLLIKMFGRARLPAKSEEVVEALEQGFGPNLPPQVFASLIQAYSQNRWWHRAVDTFDRMSLVGAVPDAITYSITIQGCINLGQFDRALQIVKGASVRFQPEVLEGLLDAMHVKGRACKEQVAELRAFMVENGQQNRKPHSGH